MIAPSAASLPGRVAAACLGILLALLLALPAAAAASGPELQLFSSADSTAPAGGTFQDTVTLVNVGNTPTDGSPLTLHATFPPGLTATAIDPINWDCSASSLPASTLTCTYSNDGVNPTGGVVGARAEASVEITVAVASGLPSSTLTSSFSVSGGGAADTVTADSTRITGILPGFGIDSFDAQVSSDPAGDPSTAAGGHPYAATTSFLFNTITNPRPLAGSTWPVEPAKDIAVGLPPGFVVDPTATAGVRCTMIQLLGSADITGKTKCPADSQVGVATLFLNDRSVLSPLPVYNIVAPAGVPARLGFNVYGTLVSIDGSVRSGGDYGLSATVRHASEGLPIAGTRLTLWGVPADPSHDNQRRCPGQATSEPCLAGVPARSLLRNPTACAGPLSTTLSIDSWFHPGALGPDGSPDLADPAWKSASSASHAGPGFPYPPGEWGAPLGIEGCEAVPFEPQIDVAPTTDRADSPTGLSVSISVPQEALADSETTAQSDLRDVVLRLPAGMSVNPARADGLGGCTLAQIDLHRENTVPSCPDSTKIGTLSLRTPLLEHAIEGSVYLAAPEENPFHSLLALYLVADDHAETGTVIKLAGKVTPDPETGRLETVFTDQPQLPFETLHLDLFDGPHAPLITPPFCGSYATEAKLSPWARPAEVVNLQSAFQITSGPGGAPCPSKPAPFDPKLSAGSQSPLAGAFTPFSLRLTREDGSQRLAGISATLPPGLLASLKGIPYCPEAALASLSGALGTAAPQLLSPACPGASQLGAVTVGAGAGPNPFYVQTGKAYLAGPYKGAPLSAAIATPALAGPFDLGNVLVRTALQVNPETAQATAISDPLPTILHGIPLDLRDVRVVLDRPGFTLNPTSCDPMAITSQVTGAEGASANPSSRFQVGECQRLGFKPRLSIKLKGDTKRGKHPALRATLRMPKAVSANIAKAVVSLPHSEFLAQSHIRTICTRVQFAAENCPKGSIYGHARAFTPLLDKPLEGPVYLRSSSNPLPDLVADLNGQIHVTLSGRIDSAKGGGIRTTFAAVPDAPVSKFTLTMQGGRKGLLENSRDLCRSTNRAGVLFDAQNGKVSDFRPVVRAAGCGEGRKRR